MFVAVAPPTVLTAVPPPPTTTIALVGMATDSPVQVQPLVGAADSPVRGVLVGEAATPLSAASAAGLSAAIASQGAGAYSAGDAAAGVYWGYLPADPASAKRIGTHTAFGDTPGVALPTSGIASYGLVGATTPTDNLGRQGSFSAGSLAVDFGARQVSTAQPISLSFGAAGNLPATQYTIPPGTLGSFAPGAPAIQAVTVDCRGCLPGSASAQTSGTFVGREGQGYALGIGVSSRLETLQSHAAGVSAGFARTPGAPR